MFSAKRCMGPYTHGMAPHTHWNNQIIARRTLVVFNNKATSCYVSYLRDSNLPIITAENILLGHVIMFTSSQLSDAS